ncbi:MAG: hypothetical protein ACI30C_00430, partial [Muribaculaceae bacterium]
DNTIFMTRPRQPEISAVPFFCTIRAPKTPISAIVVQMFHKKISKKLHLPLRTGSRIWRNTITDSSLIISEDDD